MQQCSAGRAICGNVAGTLLYNGTSSAPDTPVSITDGAEPFYISEASPATTKSCADNPLLKVPSAISHGL